MTIVTGLWLPKWGGVGLPNACWWTGCKALRRQQIGEGLRARKYAMIARVQNVPSFRLAMLQWWEQELVEVHQETWHKLFRLVWACTNFLRAFTSFYKFEIDKKSPKSLCQVSWCLMRDAFAPKKNSYYVISRGTPHHMKYQIQMFLKKL